MDDYRDLVTAGLTLLCAAIMLVAGQLYIEYGAAPVPGNEVDRPGGPGSPPPLISRGPSINEKLTEPRADVAKKRPT
jgi:hypothetical protein